MIHFSHKHLVWIVGIFTTINAYAFTDNEARKAILELREQVKASVQTIQEQHNRITQLSEELAKLRGQLEQSQNTLKEVKADQESGYASVDKRLTALEPIPPEVLAQQDYDAAVALIQKSDYTNALKAFDRHAKIYPNSTQMAEVIYWQGVAAYGTRNYKTAITRLTNFITQYPTHVKLPDALLTLGSAQIEGGKKLEGLSTLKQLTNAYPDSEATQTALPLLRKK